jgi:hypothetical protein
MHSGKARSNVRIQEVFFERTGNEIRVAITDLTTGQANSSCPRCDSPLDSRAAENLTGGQRNQLFRDAFAYAGTIARLTTGL